MEEKVRFYKANIIYTMTFLFGPCAGGWMMGVNFFHIGKDRAGWCAIVLSILLTICMMLALVLLPEKVVDAVPKFLLPVIQGGIAYLIVDKTQQDRLQEVAQNKENFYSTWKSLGVGFAGGLVAVAIILSIVGIQILSNERKWDEMTGYEEKALKLYEMIEREVSDEKLAKFIENTGIINWDKFLGVVEEMGNALGITEVELKQVDLLKKYGGLRKQEYRYILDMTKEKKDRQGELSTCREEIDVVLKKISELE